MNEAVTPGIFRSEEAGINETRAVNKSVEVRHGMNIDISRAIVFVLLSHNIEIFGQASRKTVVDGEGCKILPKFSSLVPLAASIHYREGQLLEVFVTPDDAGDVLVVDLGHREINGVVPHDPDVCISLLPMKMKRHMQLFSKVSDIIPSNFRF